jgi:HlyD family secretion protein
MNSNATPAPQPKPPFLAGKAPAGHRRRRWPWVLGGLFILLIGFGLWPKPVPVEVAVAKVGPLRVTVSDEGQTKVRNRYVISSPVAGELRRIIHKPGAGVVAGETTLAFLDTAGADLLDARTLAQAKARVAATAAAREQAGALDARAQAALGLAKSEAERARTLLERGALARQEADQLLMRETAAAEEARAAQFALQIARYEEEQAQAMLIRGQTPAGGSADPLVLTSPVSGRVLRVYQESQRRVPAGTPLLEVGDIADLEVWIEVLSRDGVRIQPGATVWLEQWGGAEPLRARVRLVEPSAWTKISALGVEEQRVWVIADLVDPVEMRPTLGDAYRVEARIVVWESDRVLQVPAGALFQTGGEWQVYALEGGRAKKRGVKVGRSNGLWTQLLDGVKEGETLLVYPGDRVRDGIRVVVQ